LTLCHANVGETKALMSPLAKMSRDAFPPSTPGLLSLILDGRKNKRTEPDDRRWILCHVKIEGDKSISIGEMRPPVPSGFAITDFR